MPREAFRNLLILCFCAGEYPLANKLIIENEQMCEQLIESTELAFMKTMLQCTAARERGVVDEDNNNANTARVNGSKTIDFQEN